jgi:hypothetical protein
MWLVSTVRSFGSVVLDTTHLALETTNLAEGQQQQQQQLWAHLVSRSGLLPMTFTAAW